MELEDAVALGHGKVRRTCIRNSLAPAKERVCDKEFRNLLIEGLVLRAPGTSHDRQQESAFKTASVRSEAASSLPSGFKKDDWRPAGRTFHLESHPG